ncbi:MAG: hypothetical protein PHV13_03210 [Candidatus ainarchaeum sp.]|nr:hypothetical protein [Candidatus ainarchaeum sp.]
MAEQKCVIQKSVPLPRKPGVPYLTANPKEFDSSSRHVLHSLVKKKPPPEPIEENHCWSL